MQPMEPSDEDKISIINLDIHEKNPGKVARILQRYLYFLRRTKRKVLGIAIAGAIFLLLVTVFPPYVVPRQADMQKARPPETAPQGKAVELAYVAGSVIYINTIDGSVNALQAKSGKSLWHYRPAFPAGRPLNVVGDTVYFTAQNSQKSFVYALQASSGKLRWQRQLPDTRLSLMHVTNDALYFMGLNGEVDALRAKDGRSLWRYKDRRSPSSLWLNVFDGIVYLTDPTRMTLSALQASTGKLLWDKQGEGAAWILAATLDIVYIQLSDTTFSAIKTGDGRQLWRYRGITQGGSFVLERNTLYLTTRTGTVVALKANDGSLLWQYKEMYPIWGSLVVASQMLYLNALDGNIYALRASDGKLHWRYTLNNQSGTPISGQVYTENTAQVYAVTNDGITYVLQTNTGRLLWQYRTGLILPAGRDEDAVAVQPAVYIIQHDNTFIALGIQSGALLWHYAKAIQEPPLLEQGMLYVSVQDGTINALSAETGALSWRIAIPNKP